MTDYKINQDIKNLLKMGLNDDMAQVIAYTNARRGENVKRIVNQLVEDQELICEELSNFIPFGLPDEDKLVKKDTYNCTVCKCKIDAFPLGKGNYPICSKCMGDAMNI